MADHHRDAEDLTFCSVNSGYLLDLFEDRSVDRAAGFVAFTFDGCRRPDDGVSVLVYGSGELVVRLLDRVGEHERARQRRRRG